MCRGGNMVLREWKSKVLSTLEGTVAEYDIPGKHLYLRAAPMRRITMLGRKGGEREGWVKEQPSHKAAEISSATVTLATLARSGCWRSRAR